jgi:hypothetical protein
MTETDRASDAVQQLRHQRPGGWRRNTERWRRCLSSRDAACPIDTCAHSGQSRWPAQAPARRNKRRWHPNEADLRRVQTNFGGPRIARHPHADGPQRRMASSFASIAASALMKVWPRFLQNQAGRQHEHRRIALPSSWLPRNCPRPVRPASPSLSPLGKGCRTHVKNRPHGWNTGTRRISAPWERNAIQLEVSALGHSLPSDIGM